MTAYKDALKKYEKI
nr:hypothetical protein [Fusobacterium varium]